MEVKKFNEYTKEEQKELLIHWWWYYGKVRHSLEEFNQFEKLVDEDSERVFDVALVSYFEGISNELLLESLRKDTVDIYCSLIRKMAKLDSFADNRDAYENVFFTDIVVSYNNFRLNNPVSDGYIRKTIERISGEKRILTQDKVIDIYSRCLLDKEELKNNGPVEDFSIGEGVFSFAIFNARRLDGKKEEIIEMVDQLADIEQGTSFIMLSYDRELRQWTCEDVVVDMLVQLGIAVNVLTYQVSRDMWAELPDQKPLIIRTDNKDNMFVNSYAPCEYIQVVNDIHKKMIKQKFY